MLNCKFAMKWSLKISPHHNKFLNNIIGHFCRATHVLQSAVLPVSCLLARDAQMSHRFICLSIHLCVHLCVCPRQLVTRMYAALRVASHLDYRLVSLSLCQ